MQHHNDMSPLSFFLCIQVLDCHSSLVFSCSFHFAFLLFLPSEQRTAEVLAGIPACLVATIRYAWSLNEVSAHHLLWMMGAARDFCSVDDLLPGSMNKRVYPLTLIRWLRLMVPLLGLRGEYCFVVRPNHLNVGKQVTPLCERNIACHHHLSLWQKHWVARTMSANVYG